jgi:hypothetical protein
LPTAPAAPTQRRRRLRDGSTRLDGADALAQGVMPTCQRGAQRSTVVWVRLAGARCDGDEIAAVWDRNGNQIPAFLKQMMRSSFLSSVLLGTLAAVFAAGGGAAGGGGAIGGVRGSGGAHPLAKHGGSSFGNPAGDVPARSGCLGAVAGVPSSGAPWPDAPAARTNSLPMKGSIVEGTVPDNPTLPHLTQQDERIIGEIKQGNEKLGTVGNPNAGQTKIKTVEQQANVTEANKRIQQQGNGPFRPLFHAGKQDPSEINELHDRPSGQSRPDVSHMSEESQSLAREIIRDTAKLGSIGNPGSDRQSLSQRDSAFGIINDLPHDTPGPRLPTGTVRSASGPC